MDSDNLGLIGLLRESCESRVAAAANERDRALVRVAEPERQPAEAHRRWAKAVGGDLIDLGPAPDGGTGDDDD